MSTLPRIAYDIQVIHDSIVRDTEIYRKFDTKSKKLSLYREKEQLIENHQELKKMIDIKFLRSLDPKRGKLVGKIGWLPAALVITDERIRGMCRNLFTVPKVYTDKTGMSYSACPGSGKLSGCPPFSLTSEEARDRFDLADVFIAIQSRTFVEPPGIRAWQDVLVSKFKKEIDRLKGKGAVTIAFGAGPCQLCHPKPCLGAGQCRMPEKRVFALESVGVPVAQLCKDMALVTGNPDWKIKFIKYFGTPRQSHKEWKITFGVAVRLQ